jgi:hypothetical protein
MTADVTYRGWSAAKCGSSRGALRGRRAMRVVGPAAGRIGGAIRLQVRYLQGLAEAPR